MPRQRRELASEPSARSPAVEAALNNLRNLARVHSKARRTAASGTDATDTSLADICRAVVTNVRTLSAEDTRDVVAAALSRRLLRRAGGDATLALCRIACGPHADTTVTSRVAGFARRIVQSDAELDEVLPAGCRFWQRYNEIVPPKTKRARSDGNVSVQLTVSREFLDRVAAAGSASAILLYGQGGRLSVIDEAPQIDSAEARGSVGTPADTSQEPTSIVEAVPGSVTNAGHRSSQASVGPSEDGVNRSEPSSDSPAEGATVYVAFAERVANVPADKERLQSFGRFAQEITVRGVRKRVWAGRQTAELVELMQRHGGSYVTPDPGA